MTKGFRVFIFLALIFTDSLLAQECTSLSEFESPLVEVDGELKSNALLFDITALQSMEITSLDIRFENSFRDNEYLVSIYTKPGTYQGFESDSSAWTESFFGRISVPSQQTSVTTLPEAAFRSIPVDAGSQQAFYVYLRSTRSTPMISIPGSREGDVAFLDGDKYLIIHQGATTSPNFEAPTATRSPMMFLGRLHYNACTLDDSTVDGLCTGENATLSTLTTRLNGAGKSKGILFDVQAKSDTTILSMDLHLEQLPSEDSCVVSVYYRPDVSTGGMVGDLMAYGDWTPLFSGAVKYGASRIVRLDPEQFTPVNLVEGDKFAFYVLVNDADKSPIVSSSSVDGDSPFATSCSLDILPGKTSDAPFNVPVSASPVGFNGVLRYSACPNENCDEDSTGGGECPTIEENPRTDIMMIVKPDTEIIRVSENKRDLRTGGSCYLAEGTRTDDCLVASYKEPCSYDGYRVQTADKRSTFVIQEDTVIFCNRTRHEKECCQGSDCVFEEEFQGSTIVMDVRESKGELANLPGIEAGSACSVCSEGDKTLVLFGSELATPTDFCSATYGWYRVRTFISPVCPLIDTDDDEDDGGSNFSQAAERFGLIALLLFTSWFMG